MKPKKPKVGDTFYDGTLKRKIIEVQYLYDDNLGWSIVCNDNVGYDCYWDKKRKCWQYWHPKDQALEHERLGRIK